MICIDCDHGISNGISNAFWSEQLAHTLCLSLKITLYLLHPFCPQTFFRLSIFVFWKQNGCWGIYNISDYFPIRIETNESKQNEYMLDTLQIKATIVKQCHFSFLIYRFILNTHYTIFYEIWFVKCVHVTFHPLFEYSSCSHLLLSI